VPPVAAGEHRRLRSMRRSRPAAIAESRRRASTPPCRANARNAGQPPLPASPRARSASGSAAGSTTTRSKRRATPPAMNTTSRPVMNPPSQDEPGNRDHRLDQQPSSAVWFRRITENTVTESEARPVSVIAQPQPGVRALQEMQGHVLRLDRMYTFAGRPTNTCRDRPPRSATPGKSEHGTFLRSPTS
jgi:hypothetical protein